MEKENKGLTYRQVMDLVLQWKYRQTVNNQPEQGGYSKAKAHIYGICSEELLKLLEKENQ